MESADEIEDDTEERTWSGGDARSRVWDEQDNDAGAQAGDTDNEQNVHVPTENSELILADCLKKFSSSDYIMEPGIFNQLKRYFQAGGSPQQVIDLLSTNYHAYAQMANLMAEWVISAGANINEVRQMVESSLTDMIVKSFDPKKADSIFSEEGETPAWLTEMIEHPTWRKLVYKLAEDYPDCLMLNFTIKLISDAGYQGEITSISTAAQQIEVFSRMLKTSILKIIDSKEDEIILERMKETAEMICHSEHTFVYSQVLLHAIMQDGGRGTYLIKRLSQEIIKCAADKGHDVTQIIMSLNGSTNYPRACQALSSMLSRNALNPADITQLYKMYSSNDPPPVDLIRSPQFLELLITALFRLSSKLNPEHVSKYIYLLAYAGSVLEVFKRGQRQSLKQNELKTTIQAIEKVLLCVGKTSSELIVDIPTIYSCIRYPVVSVGIIHWVEAEVSEPSYFNLTMEHTPIHLALLDEVATAHSLLHQKVLDLLIKVFESKQDEMEILVQLEQRKMILDRMIHLMSRGFVLPVVKYIHSCWSNSDTDISLIRYFVTEVLDIIGPPYSEEFVALFLPLVEDDDITGMSRSSGGMDSHYGSGSVEHHDTVSEFIVHCRAQAATNAVAAAAIASTSSTSSGKRGTGGSFSQPGPSSSK